MMKLIKQIFNDVFTIIYPNRCMGCDEILSIGEGKWLCEKCMPQFEIKEYKRCSICGRIIYHNGKCRVCNSEKIYFDKGYSLFEYKNSVRNAVRQFKYKSMKSYGKYLGNLMSDYAVSIISMKFDYVTAVPLHRKRLKSRGYNQAEILAKTVAKELNAEYKDIIVRHINTKPQNNLGKAERQKNIKNAFSLNKDVSVKDKTILLIDDIFTTGSTINECSKVLKKNKAARVEFLTLSCRSED